jgi:hypothetical protein
LSSWGWFCSRRSCLHAGSHLAPAITLLCEQAMKQTLASIPPNLPFPTIDARPIRTLVLLTGL